MTQGGAAQRMCHLSLGLPELNPTGETLGVSAELPPGGRGATGFICRHQGSHQWMAVPRGLSLLSATDVKGTLIPIFILDEVQGKKGERDDR